jgi:spermidine synthase
VGDGRRFLQGKSGEYDAILLNLPGPESAQLNRYYTAEFFRMARAALKPGGILSFTLRASPDYLGAEQIGVERSIWAALRESFRNVLFLPDEIHLILAGDRPLTLEVPSILAARGIETRRLLDYEWSDLSDPYRRDQLDALLTAPRAGRAPQVNRDLSPRAFGSLLEREARKAGGSRKWILLVTGAFVVMAALSTGGSRLGLAIGSSGFAAMALELELLLLYQVHYGHLYLRLSLFVTLFLMGAALGAARGPRWRMRPALQMRLADLFLVILALLVAAVSSREGRFPADGWGDRTFAAALYGLILMVAVAVGAQFAAAGALLARTSHLRSECAPRETEAESGLHSREQALTIGRLYLADLSGAASGTILSGLVLLPRIGVPGVTLVVAGLKMISLLSLSMRKVDP